MCTISMVGDAFTDRWRPYVQPNTGSSSVPTISVPVTRAEFDALKVEVELMKDLLVRAKRYDEENGEPDCEQDEKVDLLRRMAEAMGVDLSDVFGASA